MSLMSVRDLTTQKTKLCTHIKRFPFVPVSRIQDCAIPDNRVAIANNITKVIHNAASLNDNSTL